MPTRDLTELLSFTPRVVVEAVSWPGAFKEKYRLPAYGAAKLAEDPRVLADPEMKIALARHARDDWTFAKVASLSTEAIEEQIRRYVPSAEYSRDGFLKEIATAGRYSAWSVAESWLAKGLPTCREKDDDFLGMAACELWKRLAPDRPSMEMLDDWMQDGYQFEEAGQLGEACDAWWGVWRSLLPRLTPSMRTIEATDPVFQGLQQMLNWTNSFRNCLEEVVRGEPEPRFAAMGKHYCDEWLSQFTEETGSCQVNYRRAKAQFHFHLGAIPEGEATLHEIIERWPEDPWGYVALADTYSHLFPDPGPRQDNSRAIAYLEQGLALCGSEDRDRCVLLSRLEEIRRRAPGE